MFVSRCISVLVAVVLAVSFCFSADAQVSVKGHYRKDGTYVRPHMRSNPDGNFYNNWSTKGNVNPYTGKLGTRVTPPSGRASGCSSCRPAPDRFVDPVRNDPNRVVAGQKFGKAADNGFDLNTRNVANRPIPVGLNPVGPNPAGLDLDNDDLPLDLDNGQGKAGIDYSYYASGGLTASEKERLRILLLMQERREKIKANREATYASLSVKYYDEEGMAQSRFALARQLYYGGKAEIAKRWLEKIVDEYPATETADRARFTLAKL